MEWWQIVLMSLFILYAIFIVLFMRKLIEKDFEYFKRHGESDKIPEKWKPFVRYDRKNWSNLEIYFCAIFIMPIRVLLLIINGIMISIFTFIFSIFSGQRKKQSILEEEQSSCSRTISKFFIRFFIRISMFCCGIFWIPYKKQKIQDYDKNYPYENYKDRNQKPTVIVGNHMGYIESMYFAVSRHCPSFVAKSEIGKMPVLGGLGKILQCIFVSRNDNNKRNQVLEQINHRCEMIKKGKNFPAVAMFPEGTCTNGKYLLSFKKGAFESFSPIKIFYFRFFDRKFSHYLDSIPLHWHVLITMCQLYNKMEVNEFDTYYPDHLNQNNNNWQDYANQIKQIMLKVSGCKDTTSGYRECQEYQKYLREHKHLDQNQALNDYFSKQDIEIQNIKQIKQLQDKNIQNEQTSTDKSSTESQKNNIQIYSNAEAQYDNREQNSPIKQINSQIKNIGRKESKDLILNKNTNNDQNEYLDQNVISNYNSPFENPQNKLH